MKKCFAILFLALTVAVFAGSRNCRSVTDILEYETQLINQCDGNQLKELIDAYISRGETYLLLDQYDSAFLDFSQAISLQERSESTLDHAQAFRAHLGLAICSGVFGLTFEFEESIHILGHIIDEIQCSDCHANDSENSIMDFDRSPKEIGSFSSLFSTRVPLRLLSSVDGNDEDAILGPDIPPRKGWCEEIVCSTSDLMRILASKSPIAAQVALLATIRQLEEKCLACCRSGAFWKTCVAPIVKKWKEWNEKWDLLRIPPDPAWD